MMGRLRSILGVWVEKARRGAVALATFLWRVATLPVRGLVWFFKFLHWYIDGLMNLGCLSLDKIIHQRLIRLPQSAPAPETPQTKVGPAEFNLKLAAVNEAIKLNREVHLLFVLVGIYLAILFGSTTHKQLFLESDVTLPLLNVGLPIVQMYIWVPWGWLLLHFNLLLLMYILATQLGELQQEAREFPDGMRHLRQKLYVFPFPHWALGLHPNRVVSRLLWFYVVATTLVLPMVLLVWAQVRFLPYQSEWTTWFHRLAIFLDLALLWIFWPLILHRVARWQSISLRVPAGWERKLALPVSMGLLFFSNFLAVIPFESMERDGLSGVIKALERLGMERSLSLRNEVLVKELPAPDLVATFVAQSLEAHQKGLDAHKKGDGLTPTGGVRRKRIPRLRKRPRRRRRIQPRKILMGQKKRRRWPGRYTARGWSCGAETSATPIFPVQKCIRRIFIWRRERVVRKRPPTCGGQFSLGLNCRGRI